MCLSINRPVPQSPDPISPPKKAPPPSPVQDVPEQAPQPELFKQESGALDAKAKLRKNNEHIVSLKAKLEHGIKEEIHQQLPPSDLTFTQKVSKKFKMRTQRHDFTVGSQHVEVADRLKARASMTAQELESLLEEVSGLHHPLPQQRDKFIQGQRQKWLLLKQTQDKLTQKVQDLEALAQDELGAPAGLVEAKTELKTATEAFQKMDAFLKKIDGLKEEVHTLRALAKASHQTGTKLKGSKAKTGMTYLGVPTLKLAKWSRGIYLAASGALKLHEGGISEVMSGASAMSTGLRTLGIVGASLSLALESVLFYKNAKAHNKALSRTEMADVLTASPQERGQKAIDLWNQAARLRNSRTRRVMAKLNPFSKRSNPDALEAKALQIANLPGTLLPKDDNAFASPGKKIEGGLSLRSTPGKLTLTPKQKAMVHQVKKYAEIKQKRLQMLRNVIGGTAAVLTIVALSVAAPPAGLFIAAVVLSGVSTGIGGYIKLKGFKNKALYGQRSIEEKYASGSINEAAQKVQKTKKEIQALKAQQEQMEPPVYQEQMNDLVNRLEQEEQAHLNAQVWGLTFSPMVASKEIMQGVYDQDPVSLFMARTMLDIHNIEELPQVVAMETIQRRMNHDVEFMKKDDVRDRLKPQE